MCADDRYVPKIHPLDRAAEADDPLELMAEPAPGDPNVMFQCIVQEFAGMGWDAHQLERSFRNPEYPVLNELLHHFGEAEVRRRIAELLAGSGVFRVRELIDDEPEPEIDDDIELIQLNVRPVSSAAQECGGISHAAGI